MTTPFDDGGRRKRRRKAKLGILSKQVDQGYLDWVATTTEESMSHYDAFEAGVRFAERANRMKGKI